MATGTISEFAERARVPLYRRHVLAWLPLLAAGCAVSRMISRAVPATDSGSSPPANSNVLDDIVIYVIDTSGSLSPRSRVPVAIHLRDLVLYHGHVCDGLMVSARGIAFGLADLFDGGPVDRTDMAAATNASVCYGDVAEYLTGARHRYGSMVVDASLGDEWILLRRATNRAVRVALRPDVKPSALAERESALRAAACPPDLIAEVGSLQREFAARVWDLRPDECFHIQRINFAYDPGKLRGDVSKRDCPSTISSR